MPEPTHDVMTTAQEASTPFVGRWNRLISTTNWEKGRIIHEWRTAMIAADVPSRESSDEAWSLQVGGVTGQHVGRLRRVYERFGTVHDQYDGLYWSHFQAALDWDDAEMWLEGALQNGWSVSKMRQTRWETLGAVQGAEPRDEDIVSSEIDEDCQQGTETRQGSPADAGNIEVRDTSPPRSPDGSDSASPEQQDQSQPSPRADKDGASIYASVDQPTVAFVRPFEHLGELPEDVSEAFEAYKLAILTHKAAGWQDVTLDDLLSSLDALKELAVAPSHEDTAP